MHMRIACNGTYLSMCIAHNIPATVQPGLAMLHIHLPAAGTYGEFKPNKPVDVPIWLAIELRKRNQCDIRLPPWMDVQQLRETVQQERTDMGHFQPLPFHYIEVRPHVAWPATQWIWQPAWLACMPGCWISSGLRRSPAS